MKKVFIYLLQLFAIQAFGQPNVPYVPVNQNRVPIGAFQSLNMTYDERSAAMGNTGVALSPDVHSAYTNAAKLAFFRSNIQDSCYKERLKYPALDSLSYRHRGLAISYIPWERNLIGGMALAGANLFNVREEKHDAFGLTARYLQLNSIEQRDDQGKLLGEHQGKEFSLTANYAKKIAAKSAFGIGLKYIFSDLYGKQIVKGMALSPAHAFSADLNYFYTNLSDSTQRRWTNIGAVLQNIGGKVQYGDYPKRSFQPTTLKVGMAENRWIGRNKTSRLSLSVEASKLLVPTPAVRYADNSIYKGTNEENISGLGSIFQSWTSAPDGFQETIQEVMYCFGAEAQFKNVLTLRGGYHTEHRKKSDLHYFTVGAGLQLQRWGLGFAYWIPTKTSSPLYNTFRVALHYLPVTVRQDKSRRKNLANAL